jgi:hypothetical protein
MTPANQVRQVAKWLIAAFAAVGAALAAGVQISNLGATSGLRLLAAFGGAVLGLAGIVLAVVAVGKVLDPKEATTTDLRDSTALRDRLIAEPSFFGGFPVGSVDEMIDGYDQALTDLRTAQEASWADPANEDLQREAKAREARFDTLSTVVQFWRTVVIYDKTRSAYRTARGRVLLGAAMAFAGLVTFAYAANPPKTAPAGSSETEHITVSPGPRGARGPRGPGGPRGRPGINDKP